MGTTRRLSPDPRLLFLDECPSCGGGIPDPFVRLYGPQPYLHRRSGGVCKLIVTPDPVGNRHQVEILKPTDNLEGALLVALDRTPESPPVPRVA